MSHPLPGVPELSPFGRRLNEEHEALTDEDGYYHGPVTGPRHVIDDEVPDNAHWKGWVW